MALKCKCVNLNTRTCLGGPMPSHGVVQKQTSHNNTNYKTDISSISKLHNSRFILICIYNTINILKDYYTFTLEICHRPRDYAVKILPSPSIHTAIRELNTYNCAPD